MKFHGIELQEGSNVTNLTVAAGTQFPASPNDGELFFRSDTDIRLAGLYLYIDGSWNRIASSDAITAPTGETLPPLANEGDLFYLNTGDSSEGLYVYKNTAWVNLTAGAAPTFTVTGDVTGTLDGGVDVLTLSETGVTPGNYQSVSVDIKGRVTAGTNPTTLAGYGITDAQPLDTDLTALAGLSTNGVIVRTAEGAATTRTITVVGDGISITNGDGVAGNPTITSSAVSTNTASTLVLRDASGNFSAGTITADLTGDVTGALTGAASANVLKAGDTMSSGADLTFAGGGTVTGLPSPTDNTDAVNKQYLEQQIAASIPAGQIGQIPFISVDGTRTTELGYSMVKGQFIESDTELTDAYTRITSNETIFAEWSRFSHANSAGGNLTRTSGVSRFQFQSTNLATVSASFPISKTIAVSSTANTSFSGTFTITSVSSSGNNHVVFYSQVGEPDVGTGVSGVIQLDNEQPAYSAELTSWSYDNVNDVISTTVNSDSYIGFVSQQRYADYEHEVVLRSTNSDDDTISVLLAWAVDNAGREHTLSALRSTGGNQFTWRVVYNYARSDAVVVQDKTIEVKWGNGAYGATAAAAGYTANPVTGGWDDFPAGTRVRVVRTGDTITVETSDLGETTYVASSLITVDLTSAAYLEKFRGPREIGYGAQSQAAATFEVLAFSDSLNVIYDVRDGDVYEYDGSTWVLQGSTTLVDEIGYGRLLFNPYTNKTFYTSFEDQGVIKIGETGADRVMRTGDTMTGTLVVSVNDASDALRITQTGAGNALVVEDAVNPDSTPFVVDSLGRVLIGATSTTFSAGLQLHGVANEVNFNQTFYANNANGPGNGFRKSRGTAIGANVIVQDGDNLGQVNFQGADGADYFVSSAINAYVDGTPSAGIIPGRLAFFTTNDAGAQVERLRITSDGAFGLSGPSYGTAGQVLTSGGPSAPPTWTSATTGTVTSIDVATSGVGISSAGGPVTSSGTITITSNATSANTASTIVARDASGNFSAGTLSIASFSATGIPSVNGTSAQFQFNETGLTLPAGRWRLTLDGDVFGLRHNTAVAGDFTTYDVAWAANADNSVTFPAGIASTSTSSGTVRVTGGLGVTGDVYASSFNGTGTGLTALNATNLTSGTVANARISASSVTQHQAALSIAETQIPDGSILARVASNETIAGTWTFSNPVTIAQPTADNHAATKVYVDSSLQGLQTKPAVEIATTANLTATYNNGTAGVGATLTGTGAFPAIDGVTLTSTTPGENGVLVKNQTNAAHNGRYNLTTVSPNWVLTRCALCDEDTEIPGAYVFVKRGTLYTGTGWVQTVANPVTFVVGTDAISVTQFSGAGAYTAGLGLTSSGTTFNVGTASAARIVVNADNIDLATTAISAGTYNSLTVDTYGRATAGTNNLTGTGNVYVTNTSPTIVNATLTGTATFQDGTGITSWSATDTDIDGLIGGSTLGTLIESVPAAHITVGIQSNDLNDGFQVISKGAALTPGSDPYTTLAFEVKASGNTTIGGTLNVAGATTMQAPLTINSVDNQLVLQRNGSQFLVIENNDVSVNPTITSFSDVNNAKRITYRATTDEANTTATVGDVGHSFVIYGTQRLLIDQNGLSWSGTATGNGSGITALNGSNISSGTVADARLSSNVALRDSTNGFSAYQNISVATAGTNQEYLRLTPTDFASNKPYFAIKAATGSTDHWQLLLWDGTDSAGTISISATNINLGNAGGTIAVSGAITASTNITASGAVVAGGQFLAPSADTVTSPGYSWSGDNNTGMWRPGVDTISFTNAATQSLRIDSSRRVHIGTLVPEYGKVEVLVGNYVANVAADGYWLRGTSGTGGPGWLAGFTLESDSGGSPSVSLYTPNAATAGANSAQRGLSFYMGSTGQAFRLYTGGEVERLRIEAVGAWGINGANYGTAGQVLTSNGSGSSPSWQSITITTGSFADGSVSAPSITFAADTNTGIYRSATDTLAFTTAGTQAMTLDASGNTNIIGRLGVLSASPNTSVIINAAGTYNANGSNYGIQNLVTLNNTALTADRTTYAAFNRVDVQLQNSVAFNLVAEGARNIAQTSTSAGSSVDGEGVLVGATNYALHQSTDATFNRVETMYGAQNLSVVSGVTALGDNVYGSLSTAQASGAGSGITTAFGSCARVVASNAASSITNGYLFYGNFSITGAVTNRYGIVLPDTSAYSYIGGGLQIGGTLQTAGSTGIRGLGVGTPPPADSADVSVLGTVDAGKAFSAGYNTLNGSGTNWAAGLVGMGPEFVGSGTGSAFVATNMYGLAWVRGAHALTNANLNEGAYVYRAGTLLGGIGLNGIYSPAALTVDSTATFGSNVNLTTGNLNFTGVGDQRIVSTGTVDGSDTGRIIIQASGGLASNRTAFIIVSGNESSSPGQLTLTSGDTGTVQIGGGTLGTFVNGSGGLNVPDGQILTKTADTAAAPGYSWIGDTNMGMFRVTTDTLGFSTAGAERMRIDSAGDVLIGSGTSVAHGGTNARVQIQGTTNATASLTVARYSADTSGGVVFIGKGRNGTVGSASTAVVSGDVLGSLIFTGADTSTFSNGGIVRGVATQTWSTTARGTRLEFFTTANGSASNTIALTLDQNNAATFTGAVTATSFSGSGASLTALNASNLSSGTVPDARLSGSYTGLGSITMYGTLINGSGTNGRIQIHTGTAAQSGYVAFHSFTSNVRQGYIGYSATDAANDAGTIPYVAGTHAFNGNITVSGTANITGVITGNGSGLTTLNASNLSSGTIPDARLPATITSNITGNAATASQVGTVPSATNASFFVTFAAANTATNQTINTDAGLTYNPSTNALVCSGEITAFSDARLKTNVELVTGALEKVESVRGVTFNRSDIEGDQRYAGVIAQEVEEVLPEVVRTNDDGMKSVNYDGLSALLIEAVKELSEKVKQLEAKLARYE